MSPLAHLLLAAAALHTAAAAAIVPAAAQVAGSNPHDQHKLIPEITPELPVDNKEPLDEVDAPALIINEIENNVRAKPEDIPVKVVIDESQSAIKSNEVSAHIEEADKIQSDLLRNPGAPQRQEHETQNSDQFSDSQQKLSAVQESIIQTQNLLRQGVKGVGDEISNWLTTNEEMTAVQQHIQALRDSFTAQIQKLTEAVQKIGAPQPLKNSEQEQAQPDLKEVESSIKILESNFDNGVRALSEGVNIVAILRAEDESSAAASNQPTASPTPAPVDTSAGQNIVTQFLSGFQQSMSNSIENLTTAIGNIPGFANLLNRGSTTVASNVLADSPANTQRPPFQFQLPNLPQIFTGQNQNQAAEGQSPSTPTQGPMLTQLQNIQHTIQTSIESGYTNFLNLIRPSASSTAKPAEAGSNVILSESKKPEVPADPPAQPPAVAAEPAAPTAAAPAATPEPLGPIRQIISNNPVVQSIAGTVQRIQSSMTNPEKPRDTVKPDDVQTKGVHRPYGSGDSDSIDSSRLSKHPGEPTKESTEQIKKLAAKEITPPVVLQKTE